MYNQRISVNTQRKSDSKGGSEMLCVEMDEENATRNNLWTHRMSELMSLKSGSYGRMNNS